MGEPTVEDRPLGTGPLLTTFHYFGGSVRGANCRGQAIRNRLKRRGTRHNNKNNKEKAGLGSKQGREGSRVSLGRLIVEDRPLETGWEEGGPGIIIIIQKIIRWEL